MQIDLWHRWRIPEQRVDYDSRLIICPSAFSPLWSTRWPPKIRLKRIRIRRSFAKSVSWRTTRIVLIVAKKDQHMSTQPSELSFVRRVLAFCKYENHISNILLLTVSGKKAAIGELRLSISWSVQFIVILIQFCFVPLKSTLFLLISVVNRAVPKILNFVFWTRWKKIVCTFMREISDGFCDYRRGLNPPHRVKSISMGTFQDDEVKFMQLRGNAVSACPSNHIASSSLLTNNRLNKSCFFLQFCKNAWLWNFDPQTGPRPPEVRDDQKMKDFLAVKYEKKKWYHPAHDTQMADQLKQQDDSSSYGSLRGTDSESSLSRRTSTNSQRSQKTPDSANAFNTDSPVQRHAPISLVSWRFVGRSIDLLVCCSWDCTTANSISFGWVDWFICPSRDRTLPTRSTPTQVCLLLKSPLPTTCSVSLEHCKSPPTLPRCQQYPYHPVEAASTFSLPRLQARKNGPTLPNLRQSQPSPSPRNLSPHFLNQFRSSPYNQQLKVQPAQIKMALHQSVSP